MSVAIVSSFEDFIALGTRARTELSRDVLGVTACPYTYTADSREQFGLFRSYNTSNVSVFVLDVVQQAVLNPIFTCLSNLWLVLATVISVLYNLCLAVFTLNQGEEEENSPLARGVIELLGTGYFLTHAVVDPLWESIAAITRIGATLVGGATSLVDTVIDAYNSI